MRKLTRHSAVCKCRWEKLETMDTAGVANPKKRKEKGGAEKVREKKLGS